MVFTSVAQAIVDHFQPRFPFLPGVSETLWPNSQLNRSSRTSRRLPDSDDCSMSPPQNGQVTPYTTLFRSRRN